MFSGDFEDKALIIKEQQEGLDAFNLSKVNVKIFFEREMQLLFFYTIIV